MFKLYEISVSSNMFSAAQTFLTEEIHAGILLVDYRA